MGTITWVVLRPILISVLTRFFGTMVASWFDRLIPEPDKLDKVPKSVGAAEDGSGPGELGQFIQDLLYDLIDKHIRSRFVATILKKMVSLIQGAVLNAIWDELFKKKLASTPAVMSATDFVVPVMIVLSEDESRRMEEEITRVESKHGGGKKISSPKKPPTAAGQTTDDEKPLPNPNGQKPEDTHLPSGNAGIWLGEGEAGGDDGDRDSDNAEPCKAEKN